MIVPIAAAAAGLVTSTVGAVLSSTHGGTDIGPYVSGAGNGIAVLGLFFVLRAVLSGALVARPVAEIEAKLLGLTERYEHLVDDSQHREEIFADVVGRLGFGSAAKTRKQQRP